MDKIRKHNEGLKLVATNLLKTVFADDKSAFGKYGFLQNNPFDQKYPQYFHMIRPFRQEARGINSYEEIRKDEIIGGVKDFFQKGNKIAVINLSDDEIAGLKLLHPNVEISSIDTEDLKSSEPIKKNTSNHFDAVLVSNIGALGHGENTFIKITEMCHQGTLLRAYNWEEQVWGVDNHKKRLFENGWDIFVPRSKEGKATEIVTAVLQ